MMYEKIEYTQTSQFEDRIDYLEALFADLDSIPCESEHVASAKMQTLATLASAYNKGGFRQPALECLRCSEPFFCQVISYRKGSKLDERLIQSLVRGYLTLGEMDEAIRAARMTSDVVSINLGENSEETSRFGRWLNDQFQKLIAEYQKSANDYTLRARKLDKRKVVPRKPSKQRRRSRDNQTGGQFLQAIGA